MHVDATAAKAIAERSGLDKLRHIDVNILWIQEQEARDRLPLVKVCGKINPADLMTKYVDGELIKRHLKSMSIDFREGRAKLAAQLYGVARRRGGRTQPGDKEEKDEVMIISELGKPGNRGPTAAAALNATFGEPPPLVQKEIEETGKKEKELFDKQNVQKEIAETGKKEKELFDKKSMKEEDEEIEDADASQKHQDKWLCRGKNMLWARQHGQPREGFFASSEAKRGPPKLKDLWSIRKTERVMRDGRRFSVTDEWNQEPTQVRRMRQSWTGTTTFICRTPSSRLSKMSNATKQ